MFIEAAHVPFAWNLTIGDATNPAVVDGSDVSAWFQYGIDDRPKTTITLPVGMATTVYPGDFRDPQRRAPRRPFERRRSSFEAATEQRSAQALV